MSGNNERPLTEIDLKVQRDLGSLHAKTDSILELLTSLSTATQKNRVYQEEAIKELKTDFEKKLSESGQQVSEEILKVEEDLSDKISSIDKRLQKVEDDNIKTKAYSNGKAAAFTSLGGVLMWVVNFIYNNFFKNP